MNKKKIVDYGITKIKFHKMLKKASQPIKKKSDLRKS